MRRLLVLVMLFAALSLAPPAFAQTYVRLWPNGAAGTIDADAEAVTVVQATTMGTVGIQVTGTFTGTLTPECTIDGTNWQAIRVTPTDTTSAVTSMTGTGLWVGAMAGCSQVRVSGSSWSAGAAVVSIHTIQTGGGAGSGGGGGGGSVEVTEGGATAQVTATAGGALQVECVGGTCSASGATAYDHSEAITLATANSLAIGGRVSAAAPSTTGVVDNDYALLWMRGTGEVVIGGAGTAGTASANVVTVQGVASMTPVQVQSNSANIATETTLGSVLTSTNYAAAFGTAGSADSQVMSVQGIASMTPLQVQSNAANLATETTLGGVLTSTNYAAAFGTAGSADSQVMSIQGIASMTPITVTLPDEGQQAMASSISVAIASNQSAISVDSELPSAASLADNTSNPTIPAIAAYMMCFDSSTWDRCQVSSDSTQGSTVLATGPGIQFEAINFDGTAAPNTVTEGQSVRPKATTSGIAEVMLASADGTVSPQATIGSTHMLRVGIFDNANNQITSFGGSGGTSSNFGAGFPTPGTAIGFSDGTNMVAGRAYDADTDAGTFYSQWASVCIGTTSGCIEPTAGAGAVAAGTLRMTLASDDPGVASLGVMDDWDESDRAKVNLIVGQAGVAAGSGTNGATVQRVTIATDDETNDDLDDIAGWDGTAGSADSQVLSVQGIASMTPILTRPQAFTSGGCTMSSTISGASVNETAVKASAGQIYSIEAFSLDATPVYLKLYNDTTANIDETDTPVLRLMIPANSTASLGAGFVKDWATGISFSTAITFRTTTGIADNDTGALTANEVLINVCYN